MLSQFAIRNSRLLNVAFAVLLVVGAARYFRNTILLQRGHYPGDFSFHYIAGLGLRRGVSSYDRVGQQALAIALVDPRRVHWYQGVLDSYTLPPSETLALLPMSFIPWPAAGVVWWAFLHLCYLAIVSLLIFDLRRNGASVTRLLIAASLAAWLIPAQTSIELGQLDMPLLLLVVLAREWSLRRPGWAGASLGLAGALKISPAGLLGYFVLRRKWRAVLTGAMAGLGLIVLSLIVIGPAAWQTWLTTILPELLRGSTSYASQNFTALGYFLTVTPDWFHSIDSPPATSPALWIGRSLSLVTVVAVVLVTLRYVKDTDPVGWDLGYGLFVPVILIISSLAWEHYYTWLYLPFVMLLNPRLKFDRLGWLFIALFALAYLLIILPDRFHVFDAALYDRWWTLRLLLPLKVYGSIILAGLVGWNLVTRETT